MSKTNSNMETKETDVLSDNSLTDRLDDSSFKPLQSKETREFLQSEAKKLFTESSLTYNKIQKYSLRASVYGFFSRMKRLVPLTLVAGFALNYYSLAKDPFLTFKANNPFPTESLSPSLQQEFHSSEKGYAERQTKRENALAWWLGISATLYLGGLFAGKQSTRYRKKEGGALSDLHAIGDAKTTIDIYLGTRPAPGGFQQRIFDNKTLMKPEQYRVVFPGRPYEFQLVDVNTKHPHFRSKNGVGSATMYSSHYSKINPLVGQFTSFHNLLEGIDNKFYAFSVEQKQSTDEGKSSEDVVFKGILLGGVPKR